MSTESLPITPGAFAEAIKELPLAVLYNKVSELTNSIAHLYRSNSELRAYLAESDDSEEDKKEIQKYVDENEVVAASMKERIELLKTEVENRGQPWIELEELKRVGDEDAEGAPNGDGTTAADAGAGAAGASGATGEDQNGESEEGVYL
jgi:predicted RNase H-like nuclease (RuvC/YqgF family)